MLQITPQMKVLVAVVLVDFRKGIDGLAAVCKLALEQDAFIGTVVVFLQAILGESLDSQIAAVVLEPRWTAVGSYRPCRYVSKLPLISNSSAAKSVG